MKINSKDLYDFVQELQRPIKFDVYKGGLFTGETIKWNLKYFIWESGTFNSEAFFNPLYDFEVVKENRKLPEKLRKDIVLSRDYFHAELINYLKGDMATLVDVINRIIDYLKEKEDNDK